MYVLGYHTRYVGVMEYRTRYAEHINKWGCSVMHCGAYRYVCVCGDIVLVSMGEYVCGNGVYVWYGVLVSVGLCVGECVFVYW